MSKQSPAAGGPKRTDGAPAPSTPPAEAASEPGRAEATQSRRRGPAAPKQLRDEAAQAAADFGAATDVVDEAAAAALGVNRTDLRILGLVATGPWSAAALAGAAKLSPAATTTAIQRLVAAGHLTRTVDQDDRRRAVVELTAQAEEMIDRLYGPIERAGHRVLARYSPEELALITDFLRRGIDLQLAEADRIRSLPR